MALSRLTHTKYKPTARRDHIAAAVGHRQFTWGGFTGHYGRSRKLTSTVEVFDLLSEQWEKRSICGSPPPGYECPAYTVIGTTLYTFGGYDAGTFYNSLHRLDLSSLNWEEVVPRNPSAAPQRKSGCGMVPFQNAKLVVFGGWTGGSRWTNELHVFDLQEGTWSSPSTTGDRPPPCAWFTLTKIDDHRAVMFGGDTGGGCLDDVFILELGKWHWTKLKISGVKPPAMSAHAACCLAGPLTGQGHPILIVMCGVAEGISRRVLNDGWLFDVDRRLWMKVDFPQYPGNMEQRMSYTLTMFGSAPGFRQLVLHGGILRLSPDAVFTGTTILNLELQMGKWRVTKVIREDQLGMSEERLQEKMKKLWPSSSPTEQTYSKAEERPALERRLREAESRATEAERRARAAEETATTLVDKVQKRVQEAESRVSLLQQRLHQTEQRAHEQVLLAEQRATQAEQANQRAVRAEEAADFLRQENVDAEMRTRDATHRAIMAEQRLREVEEGTQVVERQAASHQNDPQFWVVHRREIELTNQELGRGGWAVVRVAKFRGTQVAAKCLHSVIISDYNRHLFVREMNMAARIRHPNLIQFIGATLQGEPIILTELMATSLRAILEWRPLNPLQITSISLDVARALNYLHLMHPDSIVHRDVSSANVLMNPGPNNTWQAKVSDYGSANFVQHVLTTGPGNPTYAAPEAANPRQQSPKMDVYSYGVVLLEMCTRRFPDSDSRDTLLQRVTQPAMVELIRHCLEQKPERRPTMSEILEQLERL